MDAKRSAYQPNRDEVRAADEHLASNAEWEKMSEIRERYHKQEYNPFHDYMDSYDLYPDTVERRQPTQIERERMDGYLSDLGKLFEGSGINWHLDGALNISLLRGDYIGVHKDIDISVDEEDLEKLDSWLMQKGYGLFLSAIEDQRDPNSKNVMERVSASGFRDDKLKHLVIAHINSEGKIEEHPGLNFLDVHIMYKNKEGKPVSGGLGAVLPAEWRLPWRQVFRNAPINLSHPGKVVYCKLLSERKYDATDVEMLTRTGVLKQTDIDAIQDVLQQEQLLTEEKYKNVLSPLVERITPDADKTQILGIFSENELIRARFTELKPRLEKLSENIATSPNKTFEHIWSLVKKEFNLDQVHREQWAKLGKIKQWMRDREVLEENKRELKS